ncbi:MAG: disulfide bond formation protein B [Alphaproteobacteria bacterium]|nr:disulfide bond formation protein B [Alphaproteobacteria bacterium]
MSTAKTVCLGLGAVALALIVGALGFQYIGNLPPCEMCHWQRWPLIAAAIIGIVGALAAPEKFHPQIAWAVILLVTIAGALGVYHAGVEWKFWAGPSACTGNAYTGAFDLNAPIVMCDRAAWRLFGISLAGYNAIFSLGLSGFASWLMAKSNA